MRAERSEESPGEIKSREVELGCHSWTVCLAAELVLNSCFSDTVFVTLLSTAVETATAINIDTCIYGTCAFLFCLFVKWMLMVIMYSAVSS